MSPDDPDDPARLNGRRNLSSPFLKVVSKAATNRKPISGAPGAHPIGTGVGAAAGGVAAGAWAGTVAGPVGAIVGAAIGAVVGGLAGKGIAEAIEAPAGEACRQEEFSSWTHAKRDWNFEDYSRAYRFGTEAYARSNGRSFDDAEPELKRNWERARSNSNLSWENARYASRDSWQRVSDSVERAFPGDSERDGR